MSASKEDLIKKLEKTRLSKVSIVKSKDKYDEEKDILVSKIGGIPYWPKEKEYPTYTQGNAKLLAQLNLDEILKQVDLKKISPYYPTRGVLQFFLSEGDAMYGMMDGVLVIYHADTNQEHSLTENQIKTNLELYEMPYEKSVRLDFVESDELFGLYDKVHPEFDAIYEVSEDLLNEMENDGIINNTGSKLGGYSFFTQNDPLEDQEIEDKIILLLQLDSDDELKLLWGDSGVATWRIEQEMLKNLDFSNIHYTWDCF